MVLKRQRSQSSEPQPEPNNDSSYIPPPPPALKRQRPLSVNRFENLSDELIFKILSYLTPTELTLSQCVCRRFYRIAGDDQIWKSAFYERFVLPRALRLPGVIRAGGTSSLPAYSSRRSKWLDDEGLSRTQNTNWKRQYRIRHNWNQGICNVKEIDMTPGANDSAQERPFFVKMRGKIVFTIDGDRGLQAWSTDGEQSCVAIAVLEDDLGFPSSLAVDEYEDNESGARYSNINVAIGFDTGRFALYRLDITGSTFHRLYAHTRPASSARITSMSLLGAHIALVNKLQMFTLYHFNQTPRIASKIKNPTEVTSLKSDTIWPPVSTIIRRSAQGICACIVYALPTYTIGWSVGMQELWLTEDGKSVISSRTASAVPVGFHSISTHIPELPTHVNNLSQAGPARQSSFPGILSQPTAFSYSHPYLLATQNDNTLTMYLVRSSAETLEITPGQRLWGHTSAVSTAHMGNRGRAVSISSHGAELRIWELEGLSQTRKGKQSIRVYPTFSKPDLDPSSVLTSKAMNWWEGSVRDRWLSFDEEKVVVHREKEAGKHSLVIYNFA